MKAAWDWDLPRESDDEERAIVDFAADLGFDTLVIDDPTDVMLERGWDRDVELIDIIRIGAPDEFAAANPDCLQTVHPVEAQLVEVLADAPSELQRMAHRSYPLLHGGDWLCLEHEESMRCLESQVAEALGTAHGVAFDAFGFRNHYACFCDACDARRETVLAETDDHEWEVLAQVSEAQLLETAERLYDHAKTVDATATVTNHVWPPFNPNPDYGDNLTLDYCTQTIAWFYRPDWSLERVEFEADRRARLAGDANTFVPFVGMFDEEFLRRPPERLRAELELAMAYGDDNLVLCTLAAPFNHPAYADVIKEVLR